MHNAFLPRGILSCALILAGIFSAFSEPAPGDVFREFTWAKNLIMGPYRNRDRDSTPTGTLSNPKDAPDRAGLDLDLNKATRAEMSLSYWGGHLGTSEQAFSANNNEWILLPLAKGMPGKPLCVHRNLVGPCVDIPLEHLKEGENDFAFIGGPQICYSFNWGNYWVNSFTVRIYYDKSRPHPVGTITSPKGGDFIGDNPVFKAEASSSNGKVKRVDFFGSYLDFDWDGDGILKEWQYALDDGNYSCHIGKSRVAPHEVTWYTSWVPDQDEPIKLMARIEDESGMCMMTPAVENVKFVRRYRSVRMFLPEKVPERFSVRVGRKKHCNIPVDADVEKATEARVLLSTWGSLHHGEPGTEMGLNGTMVVRKFGRFHDYSFDWFKLPKGLVKKGENDFYIYSETEHHMAEVNWPGPVILIAFGEFPE